MGIESGTYLLAFRVNSDALKSLGQRLTNKASARWIPEIDSLKRPIGIIWSSKKGLLYVVQTIFKFPVIRRC